MKLAIILCAVVALAGCDQYRASFGNNKVNEITVYGNIRCVLVVQGQSNTISCDWEHPVRGSGVAQ